MIVYIRKNKNKKKIYCCIYIVAAEIPQRSQQSTDITIKDKKFDRPWREDARDSILIW